MKEKGRGGKRKREEKKKWFGREKGKKTRENWRKILKSILNRTLVRH